MRWSLIIWLWLCSLLSAATANAAYFEFETTKQGPSQCDYFDGCTFTLTLTAPPQGIGAYDQAIFRETLDPAAGMVIKQIDFGSANAQGNCVTFTDKVTYGCVISFVTGAVPAPGSSLIIEVTLGPSPHFWPQSPMIQAQNCFHVNSYPGLVAPYAAFGELGSTDGTTHNVTGSVSVSDWLLMSSQASSAFAKPEACTPFTVINIPPQPHLQIDKTCDSVGPDAITPYTITCTLTVSGTNLPPGQTLLLTDDMHGVSQANPFTPAQIQSSSGMPSPPWVCGPSTVFAGGADCRINTDDVISAGGTVSLVLTAQVHAPLSPDILRNRASVHVEGLPTNVAGLKPATYFDIPLKAPDPVVKEFAADLKLSSFKVKDCTLDTGGRTARCWIAYQLRNEGPQKYLGPVVFRDRSIAGPIPTGFELQEHRSWNCAWQKGEGSCVRGDVILEQGGEERLTGLIKFPAGARPQKACLHASLGHGGSGHALAVAAQTALQAFGYDIGAIDGKIGPRSQEGLRALRKDLDLPPTDEIDKALLEALQIQDHKPNAAEVLCLRIPPAKSRAISPATTKNCPKGKVRSQQGKCIAKIKDCPEGAFRGENGVCYTRKAPSKQCDAASTVQQGNDCACRYNRMRKISRTRCVCKATGKPPLQRTGCP